MWDYCLPLLRLFLRFVACSAVIVAVFLLEKLFLGTELIGFAVFAALGIYLVHAAGAATRL